MKAKLLKRIVIIVFSGIVVVNFAQAEVITDPQKTNREAPQEETLKNSPPSSPEAKNETLNSEEKNRQGAEKAQLSFIKQIRGNDDEYLWYTLFCGAISILVKIIEYFVNLDVKKVAQDQTSMPTLEKIPLLGWFISAAIVGYLGVVTNFLSVSAQTAVAVGIGWPLVYKELKNRFAKPE